MKFKTLFMSDKEKHGHHFDLPLFNMSKQLLAPEGLSAECVQVILVHAVSCKAGASRELALRPTRPGKVQMFLINRW